MASKKKKKQKKGSRQPNLEEPVPEKSRRRHWALGFGALVVVTVILLVVFHSEDANHAKLDSKNLPRANIGGVDLPITIASRQSDRVKFVPEQRFLSRPLTVFFRTYDSPVAVLFTYPDDQFRTIHLDNDGLKGSMKFLFLDGEGRIESIHEIGPLEYLARSRSPVRYALFIAPDWRESKPMQKGMRVQLPEEASGKAEPEYTPITDPPPAEIKVGGVPLKVEIAHTGSHRNRGLMYRSYIPAGTGMLFLFPEERQQKFWMKNTRVSLDIAFIDKDFVIKNFLTMQAHDLDPTGRYASDGPVIMVLETGAGWFKANGIKKGDRLELPDRVKDLQRKSDP